jgi:16S rRNA G1207 methylase RsmC
MDTLNWEGLIQHEDHKIKMYGLEIMVRDGIFTPNPKITHSTRILMENMPNLQGKKMLDVGCGTGILSLYATARKGAQKVTAIDIHQKAILNTKENIRKYGLEGKIETYQSNLFENVEGRFDYVVANLPIDEGQ